MGRRRQGAPLHLRLFIETAAASSWVTPRPVPTDSELTTLRVGSCLGAIIEGLASILAEIENQVDPALDAEMANAMRVGNAQNLATLVSLAHLLEDSLHRRRMMLAGRPPSGSRELSSDAHPGRCRLINFSVAEISGPD